MAGQPALAFLLRFSGPAWRGCLHRGVQLIDMEDQDPKKGSPNISTFTLWDDVTCPENLKTPNVVSGFVRVQFNPHTDIVALGSRRKNLGIARNLDVLEDGIQFIFPDRIHNSDVEQFMAGQPAPRFQFSIHRPRLARVPA